MSLMSLNLYPVAFPVKTNNKRSIRHVFSSSNNTTTNLNLVRGNYLLNQTTPISVTRVTESAAAVAVDPMTVSELESEKKRNGEFWFRDWNKLDVIHLIMMIGFHGLALCAPFAVNWGAFWMAMGLYLITGVGITLGYHRFLTHRSFKIPKWLEYFLVYCGCLAGQRDPIFWVSVHKNHHNYADTEKDPHSPIEGFWFSHMGWLHYNDYLAVKFGESRSEQYLNVPELKSQWFYRFLHDTYDWHTIGLGTLLYLLGGFPYLAWGMRDPIFWVSVHKNHHNYADTEKDPHSSIEGFWFSHMGWLHYNDYLAAKFGESRSEQYLNVPELKSQWFYRFLHDTYDWHTIGLGTLLYLLGGFPYLAWGMGVRTVLVIQSTFYVASVCHVWGRRQWNTPDSSKNNWWVALLTFGEGWQNNHHAFPSSARMGLEWWQPDLTWELIKLLEMVGLVKDVKLPTKAERMKMALPSSA